MTELYQWLGYLGAVLLASGYFLISLGRIRSDSMVYHSINLFGAVMISANTFYFGAIGPALLNVVWSAIAFYYLMKILIAARSGKRRK
ncbi:MAG: CBU_0592 family membrane protein [Gammaproteobacteria bacterium]